MAPFLRCTPHINRDNPRYARTLGSLMIWLHSKPMFFIVLRLGKGWRAFSRGRVQIAVNFQGKSSECGNVRLPTPYLRLFQWRLSAPYRVLSVCVSIRQHGTTRLTMVGLSLKVVSDYFSKICWENSSFGQIWLYINTYVHLMFFRPCIIV
jgi:hypothetical protein